jgi:hypothetical protein
VDGFVLIFLIYLQLSFFTDEGVQMIVASDKELAAMNTSDSADRINLFHFMQLHPEWGQEQLAQAVGRSKRGSVAKMLEL